MGGKHMKKLRAEKSKVHLKKKTLPKSQNITNPAFTVKKIVALEQLHKVDKDEPVSNWNVPLKDLLIRLNHHNFSARLNSLCGIKELLTNYPEILKGPALKLLITKLLELVTDEEHKIRVTTIDLLSYLFSLISLSSISAFHKLLNLHLGCAMTHRNAYIQQDSLRLIDVLIKYSPEAVRCNFKAITQNFIRIMKSYFYESYAGVFSSGKSKQDLEKGKRELLLKFYQFIVTGYQGITKESQSDYGNKRNVNIFISEKVSLRGLSDHYKKIPDLTIFRNPENKGNLSGGFNSNEFMSLCSVVIPMLFDIWIEFSPSQSFTSSAECVLTEAGGELLSVLLKILLFFYDMAVGFQDTEVENWFVSNYGAAFKKSFTCDFPYLPRVSSKMSMSSEFPEGFYVYMLQNLIVCYLAYSLKVVEKAGELETKIENYVSGALMVNQQEIEILLKVAKIGIHASKNRKSNIILSKAVEAYDVTGNPVFRRCLSKILMNVALQESGSVSQKDPSILNWMKSLPDRLCHSQIFVEEVETTLKLITTSVGTELLMQIELKAEEILENLTNIKIEGITQLEGQKMIVDVLYRCCNEALIAIMYKKIIDGRMYHPGLKNYILDIFSQKLTKDKSSVT